MKKEDFRILMTELYHLHNEAYKKGNSFQKNGPVGKGTFSFSLSAIHHADALARSGHTNLQKPFLDLVPGMIAAIQRDYGKNPKQPEIGYLPGHHWSEIQKDYTNVWMVLKSIDKDYVAGMEMKDIINKDLASPLQNGHLSFDDDYFHNLCFELSAEYIDTLDQEKVKEPERA